MVQRGRKQFGAGISEEGPAAAGVRETTGAERYTAAWITEADTAVSAGTGASSTADTARLRTRAGCWTHRVAEPQDESCATT